MNTWKFILFPIAWIYGLAVRIRHWMFNKGYLKSTSFSIPVISIGNLSLGGTGKTPFVEYLIRLLTEQYKVATLSRGYGRKTTGFLMGDQFSGHEDVGDEPMQYIRKFANKITVAVDEDRCRGVSYLMENDNKLDVILLDDAFQHRYIKPGLSVLLTDYSKLYAEDYLLPVGTLRDVVSSAKRADIIIVTKTDRVLSPISKQRVLEVLQPEQNQPVYFSYIDYGHFVPFPDAEGFKIPKNISKIILFTGIVNHYPLEEHLRFQCNELISFNYPDHHIYTRNDLQKIKKAFDDAYESKKLIVTTEKDAMRLINSPYLSELKYLPLFYVPIKVRLHGTDAMSFNKQILEYVKKNKRHS
ncbi:MAG TPA: tetraacyldisaccharide 4'-kinase [Bacteroidales bacterium]